MSAAHKLDASWCVCSAPSPCRRSVECAPALGRRLAYMTPYMRTRQGVKSTPHRERAVESRDGEPMAENSTGLRPHRCLRGGLGALRGADGDSGGGIT